MDSFLLLRRLVAAIVFKGQTVSDYWWSRRTIFLTNERWVSPRYYNVDPMLLTTWGNPFKCHEEDLYLQPMIPPPSDLRPNV